MNGSSGDDVANRQAMDRLRAAAESGDITALDGAIKDVAADDIVVEWPQSGERIRGIANFRAIGENYTAQTGLNPRMTLRRVSGTGRTYIAEGTIDYGDGTPVSWVGISEFADGRLVRQTEYWGNPFEPPAWRKPWVERM